MAAATPQPGWSLTRQIATRHLGRKIIAAEESGRVDEIIQALKNAPALTVAETAGFAKRGGIINFILQDSKVGFEANVDAARQAGLNISSRLLSLARIVQTSERSR